MAEPRIFKKRTTENASMFYGSLPQIDMKRAIAVYIRQSKTGADNRNGESRETQLGLIDYAAQLRGTSSDDRFIRLYDEGAGKSGQKRIDERPQLNRLYSDLRKGEIGTIVVAREDRLFRDKHGHQVGLFTELAEKMKTVVVVPPIVSSETHLYDFTNYEQLKDFQDKMKAAYDYIHYHNGYMQATRRKKASRGEFDGRSLPPGLVVRFKEIGVAQKPLIYEPWAVKIRQLAARARELDWSIAQLNREVAQLPYLFPEPSAEDKEKYIFSTTLKYKQTPQGNGYTPHHQSTIKEWLTNVAFIGWWVVDQETNDVIEENHPAILDRTLFEEGYIRLTGFTLEGDPVEQTDTGIKRTRKEYTEDLDALFHSRLTVCPPAADRTAFSCVDHTNSALYYEGHSRRMAGMATDKLFSIPCRQFDELIIARLKELAGTDKNISKKIEIGLKQIQEKQAESLVSIDDQLESLKRQIKICEKKLMALEEADSEEDDDTEVDSEDQEGEEGEEDIVTKLVKKRKSLRRQRAELIAKKKKLNMIDSPEEVRQFFDVLSNFEHKYPSLPPEKKQRLFKCLISYIEIKTVSPHWLCVTIHWLDALSARPDIALVWRNNPANVGPFTNEEIDIIKTYYPAAQISQMLELLPKRTWAGIRTYALRKGLYRLKPATEHIPHNVCYQDLAPEGQYLFEDFDKTAEVIREVSSRTEKVGQSLYAMWLLPADLSKLICTDDFVHPAWASWMPGIAPFSLRKEVMRESIAICSSL